MKREFLFGIGFIVLVILFLLFKRTRSNIDQSTSIPPPPTSNVVCHKGYNFMGECSNVCPKGTFFNSDKDCVCATPGKVIWPGPHELMLCVDKCPDELKHIITDLHSGQKMCVETCPTIIRSGTTCL